MLGKKTDVFIADLDKIINNNIFNIEKMTRKFEDFTHQYPLSKTLRFEARPIGATRNNIIKSGLLEKDEHRAESYVKVKK